MAKRGRPQEFGFAHLLPHLRRMIPGPAPLRNMAASQRAGAKVRSLARLNRAWRDFDAGKP